MDDNRKYLLDKKPKQFVYNLSKVDDETTLFTILNTMRLPCNFIYLDKTECITVGFSLEILLR